MSYNEALEKAWDEISRLTDQKRLPVDFLSDRYEADIGLRKVICALSASFAKDHIAIIILHYLIQALKLKISPEPASEWIDFNRLDGGEGYYPAFKRRTIGRILEKYGTSPESLFKAAERLGAERAGSGDVGVIIHPFKNVAILITMWKGDEEFGPEANILFDKNISRIFCTEDIVVLTEIITHLL